jgi:hypothetical protein
LPLVMHGFTPLVVIRFYICCVIMIGMSEGSFQKQVLSRLEHVEKRINQIMEYMAASKLSPEEKADIETVLKEEKEGKLLTNKQVFG